MAPAPAQRVLLATAGLHVGGGIASVTRSIARALDEEVAAGRLGGVDCVSLADPPDAPPPARGVLRTAGGRQWRFVWDLWRTSLASRPQLVLLDHLGLGRALRLPLPGLRPPRCAVFVHGTEFWYTRPELRAAVLEGCDTILTNSEFTADSVRGALPSVADRVQPVLLCIDPALVERWEALEPASPPRELAVLIVARMLEEEPGKGHAELIEAWPDVRSAHPEARLWIAGGGDLRPRLEERARALGLGESVEFLGRISDDELSHRYRRAALFAMPSRQEGFGLVYAEALWHGLPCIGSSADAAGEVVEDGVTGRLVPYGDAGALADSICDLLGDPERRQRMGEAGRRAARERFAYPRFRRDLLAALDPARV